MKTNNAGKSTQDNKKGLELCNETSGIKSALNVQRQVAFAADLFLGDATIRILLESLAEGVVIIDDTATIVLVNKQVESLFGYAKGEVVGRPLNILLPERFHSGHPKHVTEYFEKAKIRPMGLEMELAAHHKNGHDFLLKSASVILKRPAATWLWPS